MLGRLLLGIVKGALVGAAVAAIMVKGLGVALMPGVIGWVAAIAVSALAGFVAGKPFWKGAKIEALLRALAGAALGAAGIWAMRRWLQVEVDLSAFQAGRGVIGEVPAAALPLVGATVGMLFDLDNTPGGADEEAKAKVRVDAGKHRVVGGEREDREVLGGLGAEDEAGGESKASAHASRK